jgi:DNA polymerase V
MSWRVMETLRQVLGENKVEVYSVDEAFVDLDDFSTSCTLWTAARNVKETVEKWTGIKVSVGAAPTRVLAKLANRLSKKDKLKTGCVMVLETEAEIKEALRQTAVEDIWGIGRRYAHKLKRAVGHF